MDDSAPRNVADVDETLKVRAMGDNEYQVSVDGQSFRVQVHPDDAAGDEQERDTPPPHTSKGTAVTAPMAGTVLRIVASEGQAVAANEVLLVMEAMKMETEVRAPQGGVLCRLMINTGDAVAVGDTLLEIN